MKMIRWTMLGLTLVGAGSALRSSADPAPEPPASASAVAPAPTQLTPEQRAELERTRAELETALQADPKNVELWRKLGFACQGLGLAPKAREAFAKVVALRPADAGGWYMLALVQEKLGDRAGALDSWRQFLQFAVRPEGKAVAKKHIQFLESQ